jgi:hypothetical protein
MLRVQVVEDRVLEIEEKFEVLKCQDFEARDPQYLRHF